MPEFELSPGVKMFYREDDFTDPWETPETIVLLHGNSENGLAWNGWVPQLARHFRVIRPDMRGFGKSTPMPEDHPWTLEEGGDDYFKLLEHLGVKRFHIVAAKIGAAFAVRMASRFPDRILSLSISGARVLSNRKAFYGKESTELSDKIRKHGVGIWARETMTGRLGTSASHEMLEWWIAMMDATAVSTQLGFIGKVANNDLEGDMVKITCPVLLITTEGSSNSSLDEVRAQVAKIKRGELLVLPGDSYHPAATMPEECAAAVLKFIEKNAPAHAGAPAR